MKSLLPFCFLIVLASSIQGSPPFHLPSSNLLIELGQAEISPGWEKSSTQPKIKPPSAPSAPVRFWQSRQSDELYQKLEFQDGTTEEVWRFSTWLGWKTRAGEYVLLDAVQPIAEGPIATFFNPHSPAGLGWIQSDYLIPSEAAAPSLLYFATELKDEPDDTPARAWIRADTKQPSMVQLGSQTFTYQFPTSLTAPPLPPELEKLLAKRVKVNAFIDGMRKRQAK